MAFTEGFFAADTALVVANMNACLLGWGPKADFPAAAAGNKGRVAWATDEKTIYYSDGSAWQPMRQITTGSYTGDASANKAIAHGLGLIPDIVLINPRTNAYSSCRILRGQAIITGADTAYAVTAPDATNFYVGTTGVTGSTGNANTIVYDWVAFA